MLKTKSIKMQKCLSQISQAAKTNWSIVLQGKTGTGKTMMAQLIHDMSNRHDKPFIELDIGTIPESTIESELFGHIKGAFTGAESKKIGFFEAANSGTIFIDELENITPAIQVKLLRVIDKKIIYPMGSITPVKVDVRIIVATNQNLKELLNQGKLKTDLYYRLNGLPIDIPPLRNRLEDLPCLANEFLKDACKELERDIKIIPENVMDYLSGYSFPGNIRELINIMRRAALYSGDNNQIAIDDIGKFEEPPIIDDDYKFNVPIMPLRDAVSMVEKFVIKKTLNFTNDNKSKTAKILRISESTLFNKLSLYGIKIARYAILFILIMLFTIDYSDNFRRTRGSRIRNRTTSQRIKNKELS